MRGAARARPSAALNVPSYLALLTLPDTAARQPPQPLVPLATSPRVPGREEPSDGQSPQGLDEVIRVHPRLANSPGPEALLLVQVTARGWREF